MTQAVPGAGWAGAPPGGPAARAALVETARRRWVMQLIERSRRDSPLELRAGWGRTLELVEPHGHSLHQLIAGVRTPLARLLPAAVLVVPGDEEPPTGDPDGQAGERGGVARRLEEIRSRARQDLEERGLETMCLAHGLATWAVSDGGRAPQTPVLLVPVGVEARGERMALQRRADPVLNIALVQMLAERGCPPVDERLVNALDDADTAAVGGIIDTIVAAVCASAAHAVAGFTVSLDAVIGTFSFERVAMARDLDGLAARLATGDVVAALAGDAGARAALAAAQPQVDPRTLDGIDPDDEFLPLESDSSQQMAVVDTRAGSSTVVEGAPGTGRSQTIANLVAELAARGRSVLLVAQKSTALEVVRRRLEEAGLGQLILDLHGGVTRREVMAQFAQTLELVRASTAAGGGVQHRELVRRRDLLVRHSERMNTPLPPTGLTLHRLLGLLTQAPPHSRSSLRFGAHILETLSPDRADEIRALLEIESGVADLLLGTNPSAWAQAQLPTDAAASRAHAAAVALDAQMPAFHQALEGVLGETRLRRPRHLAEIAPLVDMVAMAGRLMDTYTAGLWALDLDEALAGLALGLGRGLAGTMTRATYPHYRRSESRLLPLRTGRPAVPASDSEEVPAERLHAEVVDAIRVREVWRADAEPGVTPRGAAWLPHLRASLTACHAALPDLQAAFEGGNLSEYPLHALPDLMRRLAADGVTAHRVPLHCGTVRRLRELRVDALIDLIVTERRPAETWGDLFNTTLWQSAFDAAWMAEPALGSFSGDTHKQIVTQFARLDRDRVALASSRVRSAHAARAVSVMNAHPEQAARVRAETARRTGHVSVRHLMAPAGDVLTALKPCWMMSPLAVSELIDADREHFDVVVVDEASRLAVEDAVPALARGRTCIALGDRMQLPPQALGVTDDDTDAEDGSVADPGATEDLLSAMASFLRPRSLRWQHGSTDERLVAFSNARVYGGSVITFPAADRATPLRVVRVDGSADGLTPDGDPVTASPEVARVVELIRAHASERPERTLGVIVQSPIQGRRIEAALGRVRRLDAELERWCDRTHVEPLAIKSIDRFQGDVRDDVILSLGWRLARGAPPPAELLSTFAGVQGARRLNVAVTRARRSMTVVASFGAAELEAWSVGDGGLALLRDYLAYATAAGEDPAPGRPPGAAGPRAPDELERDIAAALRAEGLPVTELMGTSRMPVEIALGHPHRPGVSVLAVEGDGAAYAEAPTARDRDLLRRQRLEALGWSYLRVWGLEWYLRRDAMLARIRDEHRAAVHRFELRERGQMEAPAPSRPAVAAAVTAAAPRARERPPVPIGRQITDYSPHQIWQVMTWVLSDGRLRTDDEIVAETAGELGFPGLRPWIDERIRAVLRPPG